MISTNATFDAQGLYLHDLLMAFGPPFFIAFHDATKPLRCNKYQANKLVLPFWASSFDPNLIQKLQMVNILCVPGSARRPRGPAAPQGLILNRCLCIWKPSRIEF